MWQPLEVEAVVLLPFGLTELTMGIDKVRQVKVQLSDGYIDVIRVNTEAWMKTIGRFF